MSFKTWWAKHEPRDGYRVVGGVGRTHTAVEVYMAWLLMAGTILTAGFYLGKFLLDTFLG